jgi:hypothetical protein
MSGNELSLAVWNKGRVFIHYAKRAIATLFTVRHGAASAFCVQHKELLFDGEYSKTRANFFMLSYFCSCT